MADDSWRTHAFRQNVVAKIDEAIRQSGMNTSRNSLEMENHVFQKAKNKEEYLSFVARLILHVREMNRTYVSSLVEHAKQSRPNSIKTEEESEVESPIFHHQLPKNGVDNSNIEDLLISLVQMRPALWDSRLPLMERSKTIKDKLWLEIYNNFKGNPLITLELLQKKWKNLEDNFIKTKMEIDTHVPTGNGALEEKKVWKYFDSLKFLCDTIMPRITFCSFSNSNPGPSNEAQVEEVESKINLKHSKKGQPGPMGGVPGSQQQQAPGMPDPINALQNLASQGSRNAMVGMGGPPQPGQMGPGQGAANLLQTLNRGPGGQQIMMGGGMPGNMQMQLPRMQNMGMPPNSQIPGQMPMLPNQMGGQMGGQMNQQMQMQGSVVGQMMGPRQMGPGGMQMGPGGMQGPMGGQMMGSMQQLQQPKPPNPPNAMLLNPSMMGGGGYVRQSGPGQMFAQSPLQAQAQSPAGGGLSQPPSASPALAPSPGIPMGMISGPRPPNMAPSPGGSLNTPGQPGQSPLGAGGPMTDEQAYREKVRQLSKYIDPLRKMIAKMGNDGKDVEKMSKMKKLLEILSNPQQRMPLDTLIKCEIVLEKIDFKRGDGSVSTSSAPHLPFKEPHVFHSLLDAVAQNLQSPVINHTLHRTFGPTLDSLFGPEFKLVPPLKKAKLEEPTSDIPDVLQGEIARLDQRFKVSLDPNQQPGSKRIQLTCWLDDKQLPCVPPISLMVPEEYPKEAPTCHMASHEYNATKFLSDVQSALLARMKKLPKNFSVSQLLDTWEMSVRQASAPSNTAISSFAILMGL